MLQTLKNAWRTKDIRAKLIFTLIILLLYRIGTVVPVPYVDANNFAASFQGTILEYMDILSGGELGAATLFALGVSPYINASIVLQLLGVVFPNSIGAMAKNDKKKMGFVTRIVTVVLAIVTAVGYYFLLARAGMLTPAATKGAGSMWWFYAIVIITCYVAGASLIMWLADRINERGIGNGISIILFANIISVLPSQMITLGKLVVATFSYANPLWYVIGSIAFALAFIALLVASVVFVIFITGSERRIPVQYAKKNVGRKMYGGQNTHLPIKLNMTGVMPVIFASSIVSLVPTILALCGVTAETEGFWGTFSRVLGSDGVVYPVVFFILIIAFAYFYTQITFNPIEVANNLKMNGGAIPGIRQGRPTSDHIRRILNKITLAGALFLSIIAVLPIIAGLHIIEPLLEKILMGSIDPNYLDPAWLEANILDLTELQETKDAVADAIANCQTQAASLSGVFTFGGTSLIIVVGVALETFRDLEAQLTMRNYKGFLN